MIGIRLIRKERFKGWVDWIGRKMPKKKINVDEFALKRMCSDGPPYVCERCCI